MAEHWYDKPPWLEVGTIALPALSTLGLGLLGKPWEHPWWTIALGLVFAAGIWCIVMRHKLKEAKTEQDRVERERLRDEYQARLSTQVTLIDEVSASVGGLLDVLARLAREAPAARAHQLLPTHQQIVVELLKVLRVHHERGRAILYLPEEDGTLTPVTRRGRHDRARIFEPGTPRGDAVWEFLRKSPPFICNDVDDENELPEGWEGTASDYKAFVACPIVVNYYIYGMLTYDVPDAGTLQKSDADVVMIYAAVAGLASRVVEGR